MKTPTSHATSPDAGRSMVSTTESCSAIMFHPNHICEVGRRFINRAATLRGRTNHRPRPLHHRRRENARLTRDGVEMDRLQRRPRGKHVGCIVAHLVRKADALFL